MTVASYGGTKRSRMREAQVVRTPFVQMLSLTARGMPWSGERTSPRAKASAASAACCRACSAVTVT